MRRTRSAENVNLPPQIIINQVNTVIIDIIIVIKITIMIINNTIIFGVILFFKSGKPEPKCITDDSPSQQRDLPRCYSWNRVKKIRMIGAFLSPRSYTNNLQYVHQSSLAINQQSFFFVHESIFRFRRRPDLCGTTSPLSRLSHTQVIQRG